MDYLQDWLSEFTDEVVTKATDIVSKLEDLKGVEHTGKELKNGFSVRLYSPSADYSMWVDIYITMANNIAWIGTSTSSILTM